MQSTFKKTALSIAATLIIAMLFTACQNDENPTTSSTDGNKHFAPTVPPPPGGWTAEEQALITEFGEIEEVDSFTPVPGTKITIELNFGRPKSNCTGFGLCGAAAKHTETDPNNPQDTIYHFDIQIGNMGSRNGIAMEIDNDDSSQGGDGDGGGRSNTENGLVVVEDYIDLDDAICSEMGVSSCIISPGLYLADFSNSNYPDGVVYLNADIEE